MPEIDTGQVTLRTLAGAATPGPWQVVTYRTPFSITRHDGTTCSGEHVGRDIATVRHHPQSHAPYPIVTLGIGVTQETPVHFVFIRPEDADYLAEVSPEVVLALLDTIDALRASLAAAEKERDEALRDAIKFTQKVDAGIVRDEEYLRLHREKMEQYDRRVAAEARAEKAEAERDALQAWQPIETAPRDGTPIWCYWPKKGQYERQGVGWYVSTGAEEYWTDPADSEPEPPALWMSLPLEPGTAALAARKPCDPADTCAFAQDLASDAKTLDFLLDEATERAKDAEARVERMRAALHQAAVWFDAMAIEHDLEDRKGSAGIAMRRAQACRVDLAEQEGQ